MSLTLFEKLINKEIPAEILYEDDISIVLKDISPQARSHLLIYCAKEWSLRMDQKCLNLKGIL